MTLTDREKAIIAISNAISVYSIYIKDPQTVPKNISMIDFVLKSIPENLKKEITIELIDEVFEFVSRSQSELS